MLVRESWNSRPRMPLPKPPQLEETSVRSTAFKAGSFSPQDHTLDLTPFRRPAFGVPPSGGQFLARGPHLRPYSIPASFVWSTAFRRVVSPQRTTVSPQRTTVSPQRTTVSPQRT